MLKILRNRLLGLGRDEDGVALVVTLGVFMFLYVVCASVYAVGWTVKEKLQLQGACDAAAYSAAIVQADTFSRIATINRAMSWTYQQMTRRQMDYIVWQWLEETVAHYKADRSRARNHALSCYPCELGWYRKGIGWNISNITLNGRVTRTVDELENLCGSSEFGAWIRNGSNRPSFYSRTPSLGSASSSGLGRQIDDDLRNIRDMSTAVEQLAQGLPQHVDNAVRGILNANLAPYMLKGDCQYSVTQSANPRTSYFRTFSNSSYDELIFLSLGDSVVKDLGTTFGNGIDTWFQRGGTRAGDSSAQTGIHRLYDPKRTAAPLKATWSWWAHAWKCVKNPLTHYHGHVCLGDAKSCGHGGHYHCRCQAVPRGHGWGMSATCMANNDRRYDNRFSGKIGNRVVWAKPLKLTEDYFGPRGTITVALARRNENPWFSLFGRVTGGLYSAFSPIANSWSYCFASAKAGYKLYHVPEDYYIYAHRGDEDSTVYREDWEERYNGTVRVYNGPRDYCVDWKPESSKLADWITPYKRDEHGNYVYDSHGRRIKENKTYLYMTNPTELRPSWRQSWNLVQDDWDAVMIPVRQGGSAAYETEAYDLREWWRRRIQDYARNRWKTIPYRFEPAWLGRNRNYLASLVRSANWQRLSGQGRPNTSVTAGPVNGDAGDPLNGQMAGALWESHWKNGGALPAASGTSRWHIGQPGQRLDWSRIGDEMYH